MGRHVKYSTFTVSQKMSLAGESTVNGTISALNPPRAAGPPRGRRGPQKVFFVGTPELLVGQLYKKVGLAGERTYVKVPSKNQASPNSSVLVLLCGVHRTAQAVW